MNKEGVVEAVGMATQRPHSQSELELYRVLQRANLLQYYGTFVSQGGDDVQQLCEAGEEEFLEIMALVGMASKPLHVRRLQKALQEWVTNPSQFQRALDIRSRGGGVVGGGVVSLAPGSIAAAASSAHHTSPARQPPPTQQAQPPAPPPPQPAMFTTSSPKHNGTAAIQYSPGSSPGAGSHGGGSRLSQSPDGMFIHEADRLSLSSTPQPTPVLTEEQIAKIARTAESVASQLPPYEAKALTAKKHINQAVRELMSMPLDDPLRLDLMRKYGAIYGRFDSKRNSDKPMSLHEISVNEASAQLCSHLPTLLTRREDLFPLARQVVRNSGYHYSKGHSSAKSLSALCRAQGAEGGSTKRQRLDPAQQQLAKDMKAKADMVCRESRLAEIVGELAAIAAQQESIKAAVQTAKEAEDFELVHSYQAQLEGLTVQQLQLLTEQSELHRQQRKTQRYLKNRQREEEGHESFEALPCSPGQSVDPEESYTIPPKSDFQKTKQFMQNSLIDEGLRIAQQYGMADFASELVGLKSDHSNNSNKSEDEGKNESEANGESGKDEKEEGGKRESGGEEPVKAVGECILEERDENGAWKVVKADINFEVMDNNEAEEVDEQEEWNREVELDARMQNGNQAR